MRRQSEQSSRDFMKWQPHESSVRFERDRQHHVRMHVLQVAFNVVVAIALVALAFGR